MDIGGAQGVEDHARVKHKQMHFKKGGKDRDNRQTRQLGLLYSVMPPHLASPVFTPS